MAEALAHIRAVLHLSPNTATTDRALVCQKIDFKSNAQLTNNASLKRCEVAIIETRPDSRSRNQPRDQQLVRPGNIESIGPNTVAGIVSPRAMVNAASAEAYKLLVTGTVDSFTTRLAECLFLRCP